MSAGWTTALNDPLTPGEPCWRCGARAGFPCKHRPNEEPRAPLPPAKPDWRTVRDWTGNGRNFHRRRSDVVVTETTPANDEPPPNFEALDMRCKHGIAWPQKCLECDYGL